MALEEVTTTVVESLPAELSRQLVFFIQAIGGLLVLYLIFFGVRLYYQRKTNRFIQEISEDVKMIKMKLKIPEREKEGRKEKTVRRMKKVDRAFGEGPFIYKKFFNKK